MYTKKLSLLQMKLSGIFSSLLVNPSCICGYARFPFFTVCDEHAHNSYLGIIVNVLLCDREITLFFLLHLNKKLS